MKTHISYPLFACIFALLAATPVRGEDYPQFMSGVDIEIDRDFSEPRRQILTRVAERAASTQVESPDSSLYNYLFGSTSLNGVLRFMDERISVLMVARGGSPTDGKGVSIAANVGFSLWWGWLHNPSREDTAEVNGHRRVINSARLGIIELYDGFFDTKAMAEPGLELGLLGMLAHEARHSDCTGGMHRRMIHDRPRQPTPAQNMCGHLHTRCPANHPLAGEYACDNHPWGAYTFSTIFAASMYLDCKNCSERERQVMRMQGIEYLSRVLPWDDMANGKAGPLDLTSSDKVID